MAGSCWGQSFVDRPGRFHDLVEGLLSLAASIRLQVRIGTRKRQPCGLADRAGLMKKTHAAAHQTATARPEAALHQLRAKMPALRGTSVFGLNLNSAGPMIR